MASGRPACRSRQLRPADTHDQHAHEHALVDRTRDAVLVGTLPIVLRDAGRSLLPVLRARRSSFRPLLDGTEPAGPSRCRGPLEPVDRPVEGVWTPFSSSGRAATNNSK